MILDYWNGQHQENNKKALTGTTLEQYCEFFGLTPQAFEERSILEIGVGMGIATRHIGMLTDDLDVLDISEVAIEKVLNWISEGYTYAKDLAICKYDIAISHLVAQHMNDSDLLNQLIFVIKSLKQSGVLYIQFADATSLNPQTAQNQMGGGIIRTLRHMEKLINDAGGTMEVVNAKGINTNVTFYGVEVRKI